MAIQTLYAQIACLDLDRSLIWFGRLLGRAPDARPMKGLAEWRHGESGGLQLFEAPEHAGHGTLTLVVGRLREERDRLNRAGLEPGDVEAADSNSLVRLRDPDGNLVVLAEPGRV